MNPITPGLAGHKGPRGDILLKLKKAQPATAKELADVFGISANAIRRHLKELEAEGLVVYGREQRGTGAPTYTYRLSENGEALFPKQYSEALRHALTFIAQNSGREKVREMFAERFRNYSEQLRTELVDATLEEKVEAVVKLLSQQGFMAAWSDESGEVRLAQHNCAVRDAAEQFPEICAAEADFLREILESEIKRDSYIPEGCNSCQYSISPVVSLSGPQDGASSDAKQEKR
ncbi:MAG: HTH domain-containing protein [Gemmatimonadota bacterium]|nr:MAG: HTH domain-containing protein [Gemmatimonadota bacterium]